MRKIILAAAIAGSALSLAACSESTEDAAGAAVEGAANDVEANAEEVGQTVETGLNDAGAAVSGAVDSAGRATDEAGDRIEADVQDESVAEASRD
ncbi:hypothetical protein PK98_13275 [Croceibacterium mercuriale]|uniref:Entericidin EcnAB n=1 Tax=Croceibacterium mercuriale TaxID=1572751 RepID=A0A0B2BYU1_9SPHN|nr:hypothetical protein [Croceibacterium mercuriale]KHL24851.1 hypothetical protein PK98_13275 [Croceibacterium mercuriale]